MRISNPHLASIGMAMIHVALSQSVELQKNGVFLNPGMFGYNTPRMPTPGKRRIAAGRRAGKQCRHGKAGRS